MKPAPFDYVRPATLDAAFVALTADNVVSTVIAGGQSLLPMLALRVAAVDLLVDIGRLEELKEVMMTPDALRIGALTTHAAIEDGKVPDISNGLMRRVAGGISYRAIRHHGTIGGSIALADPAADWPACLVGLGAKVRIARRSGEGETIRRERVATFITGQYATTLAAGEIVLGFELPRAAPRRVGFAKVARKSGAFASSIAVAVEREEVTVVLTAASTRPRVLEAVAAQAAQGSEEDLRRAIAADLAVHAPEADAYQQRLHTATILRAVKDMRAP